VSSNHTPKQTNQALCGRAPPGTPTKLAPTTKTWGRKSILGQRKQDSGKKFTLPEAIIMPSTAKLLETTANKAVGATLITRVHGQPTQSNYETLKSDASALVSEVEDIT
jgi:hypothetical protein